MAAAARLLLLIALLSLFLQTPSLALNDEVALLQFKQALKNSSALDSTWQQGTGPCVKNWKGVECDGNRNVSGLILVNLGLSGASDDIDIDALSKVERLRFISLENNSFSGPMPAFNRLTSLRSLYISGNQFSGEIPNDYFKDMGSLKKLELSRNKFSGSIPASIGDLDYLVLVLLDNNEFSGLVPSFTQESLKEIDLSNNKLLGEIPQNMSKFGRQAFEKNPGLCGSVISKPCQAQSLKANPPPPEHKPAELSSSGSATRWTILCIVVAFLLATILFNKNKKSEQNFSVLGKEALNDVVELHIPGSNRKSSNSSRKGGGNYDGNHSSRRGPSSRKHNGGDLVMVNEVKGIFGLQDLMEAAAEVLGSGGVGSAYKAMLANGEPVVVKRFRDMNKLNKDAFDNEVGRMGRIKHLNVLPLLAYHYRKEEKLLVSEFVPNGSLLHVLHGDRGTCHAKLTWPIRLQIIKGVAQGMGFLHTEYANYELPHGNLKSSNILLSQNYEPLLTDYGINGLISNPQALFSYKFPQLALNQSVSPKCDVYCLGIVILEIMTGKFPSQYLNNQTGGTDVVQWVMQAIIDDRVMELIDPEISNLTDSLVEMEKMLKIGAHCTEFDYGKRIEMKEAIRVIDEVQET